MGHVVQKRDVITELFFNFPQKEFHIRELARTAKIPKSTLQREIQDLLNTGLVIKKKRTPYPVYVSDETNFWYKFRKRESLIEKIYYSGLIEYLDNSLHPKVIILFGSGAKGEYVQKSDIDLFVLSSEKQVDVVRYEKKLKRKVNLLIKEDYIQLSPELFNNIINGYKLKGYIKLK
ncbi:MAG: nucleotidyltransferase domain-containing protein [Nanoarchaeota archaeon]